MTTSIIPPALNKGNTIAFVSPSLRLNDDFPTPLARGKAFLETLGFPVKVIFQSLPPNATIADSVRVRCKELHAAFTDPEVKAIICTSGGSHANELMSSLDYDLIRAHPKIFVGYSDITCLHMGIQSQTGLRTFYGPTVLSELADFPAPMQFTVNHLLHVLCEDSKPVGPLPRSEICTAEHNEFFFRDEAIEVPRPIVRAPPWRWVRQGHTTGCLQGGTVEYVVRLLATPYILTTPCQGLILVLESAMGDDMRLPYTVDKFRQSLVELAISGVFCNITGLVIGRGYKYDEQMQDQLATVVTQVFDALVNPSGNVPVLMNVDFGHSSPLLTLPLGAVARLDSESDEFTVLEAGVRPQM
ncbi:S66 peptidase family protein [Aspergillus alliaceus]|uniref:S66 peptidase family protein n=1 Tax=Petromyces alliaceus TaxID=209559 RepID=UPI0012A68043|nr:peptidase family S66 [Aspergillus alliaceus]KAB8227341.1 peptidase family S66 [Aspergillus alliaceus]